MFRNVARGFVLLLLAFSTVGENARAIPLTYSLADPSLAVPDGCCVPKPPDGSARIAELSDVASNVESTILDPGGITLELSVHSIPHTPTNGGQFFTTVAPAAGRVAYGGTQSEAHSGTPTPDLNEFFNFNLAETFYFAADPAPIDLLKTSFPGMYGPHAEIGSLDDKLLSDTLDAIVIQQNDATSSPVLPIGSELAHLSDTLPSGLNLTRATGAVARESTRLDLAVLADSGKTTAAASSARSLIVLLLFTLLAVTLAVLSSAHQEAPMRLSPFLIVRLTISNAICGEGSLLLVSLECPQHLLRSGLRLKLAGALGHTASMTHANPRFVAFDFVTADYRLMLPICQRRAARRRIPMHASGPTLRVNCRSPNREIMRRQNVLKGHTTCITALPALPSSRPYQRRADPIRNVAFDARRP